MHRYMALATVGFYVLAATQGVMTAEFMVSDDRGARVVQSSFPNSPVSTNLEPRWTNGMTLDEANWILGDLWRVAEFEELRPLFLCAGLPFPESVQAVSVVVAQDIVDDFRELFGATGDIWGVYEGQPGAEILGLAGIVNGEFRIEPTFMGRQDPVASQGFWMEGDIRRLREERVIDVDVVYDIPCSPKPVISGYWCGQPLVVVDGEDGPTSLMLKEPALIDFWTGGDALTAVTVRENSKFEMQSGRIRAFENYAVGIIEAYDNGTVEINGGRVDGWQSAVAAFNTATVHVSGGEVWSKDDSIFTQAILLNDESQGVITGAR